jgi:hypothetical protein
MMDSQTDNKKSFDSPKNRKKTPDNTIELIDIANEKLEDIIDENLITLQKVHAILLNCINLTKKQKLEFAESERYFMKKYLKKLTEKIDNNQND